MFLQPATRNPHYGSEKRRKIYKEWACFCNPQSTLRKQKPGLKNDKDKDIPQSAFVQSGKWESNYCKF